MDNVDGKFGKVNPNAPAELSRFAFLIGECRCDAKVKAPELPGCNTAAYYFPPNNVRFLGLSKSL